MRKLFLRVLLLTIPFGISACGLFDDQSTPYGYVKSSFRIIDEHALYANGDWIIERESYLSEAKSIDNYDDAHRIVKSALAFAGGKHSALVAPVTDTTEYEELPSEFEFMGRSGASRKRHPHLLLPPKIVGPTHE